MKEGHLIMSEKERKRMMVFDRVKQGQLNLKKAAFELGISYRQTRRSYKRFSEQGALGLVHRNRGKPSNRAKPAEFKKAVLLLFQKHYRELGPTLAAEKLAADGYVLDHETLRRWLVEAGLWQKSRRHRQHRQRRERREHFGELVQMDGSHHKWFGPNKSQTCLIVMIDDATNIRHAFMAPEETIDACMKALKVWIKRYGIPKALYTDRKNIYITEREPTLEEQLAGKKPMTVFAIACEKLGIEIIPANSPQAKGRVERAHGVYQDRFAKELKLSGITTIDGANEILLGGFNHELNKKFSRKPKSDTNYHRPVPKGMNLDEILCFEHTRTVTNDWTIRFENQVFQILKKNQPLPRPKDKVTVRILLDGRMQLVYRKKKLRFEDLGPADGCARPKQKRPAHSKAVTRPKHIPSANHPWRQRWKGVDA